MTFKFYIPRKFIFIGMYKNIYIYKKTKFMAYSYSYVESGTALSPQPQCLDLLVN